MSGSGHPLTSRPLAVRAVGLLAVLGCLPAAAQSTIPSSNDWQYELVPYLWFPGVRSEVKGGPLVDNTFSVKPSSTLSGLDFAAMGTLEARKGDWGGFVDAVYAKLNVSNQWAGGLLGG
ncbi:MAG TPA: hypothetical protein VGI11_03725, partial [Variovorax sp.]